MLDDPEKLCVSPRRVAELLEVSTRTVYRWIDSGDVPVVYILGIRRIPLSWLRRRIEAQEGTCTSSDTGQGTGSTKSDGSSPGERMDADATLLLRHVVPFERS